MSSSSRLTQETIVYPNSLHPQEEQSDERNRLARAERRSKLDRVSSIPGNNFTLRTLQNSPYMSPVARLNAYTHPSQHVPTAPLVRPGQFPISESMDPLDDLRVQRLLQHKESVYIPPMAKVSLQAPGETLFPLLSKVQGFLEGNSQVMLILGDSGAGKSTFNRHLEYHLWVCYTTGGDIPLFINLAALDRPDKQLVEEQLRTLGFSDIEIRGLKETHRFVLICDGYDESHLTSNLHTTNLLNQSGQWRAKLIISCRTQYLGPDYRDRFVPKAMGQYQRPANDLFQEAVIAPFSVDQIEDYIDQYVLLEPRMWQRVDYMRTMTAIPNLIDLVTNPFLLTLCLEALPSVVQGKTDLSSLCVTRIQLYDSFVANWLGVNKRRLQDQLLTDESRKFFEELKEEGFEMNGIKFQQNLAMAIFKEQDGLPIVDYIHRRDRTSWKASFFSPDPEATILRKASLLTRSRSHFRFIHRSILEFFFSCNICPPASLDEFAPQECFDFSSALLSIGNQPLSQRDLVAEPSIVRFLSERVQLQPAFKEYLLAVIEMSKTQEEAARAAANAVTILVRAGTRFNGADLQCIRIPGADLSGGQFDSAKLAHADLTNVNFSKSWIRRADFRNARMEGVRFGELPFLTEGGYVFSCAFSPDGKSFAAGLVNGDINMYETARWTRLLVLQGHKRRVTSLAFSPNGRQLLSASWDEIRMWCIETGAPEQILEGEGGDVSTVALSPCGMWIASAGQDMGIGLLNSFNGDTELVLVGHTSKVLSLAYSPNGRSIVSGGEDGSIRIFDVDDELAYMVWESGCEMVNCVAYSPDGQRIVSGHGLGQLRIWDAETGVGGSEWTGHAGGVNSVVYSPSGQWIASSSDDSTVKLWDAQAGALVSIFAGHFDRVTGAVFSPSGSRLASSSWDKTVRIWEVTSVGTRLDTFRSSDPISSVTYSSDGRTLLSGSDDGTIQQYNASTGEPGKAFSCGFNQAGCIAYSPNGLKIAAAGNSNDVRVWDDEVGFDYFVLTGHNDKVNAVRFSPHGDLMVTASDDTTLRLWDASSGEQRCLLRGHTAWVRSVAFSPDGLQIVSASKDGTIRVWLVADGTSVVLTKEDDDWVRAVCYSPDGQLVASSHRTMEVRLWDREPFSLLHTLRHNRVVGCIAFSACGKWIATGCGHAVWLWGSTSDKKSWSSHVVIREFSGDVVDIAWKPRSLEFATGCRDGSVRVWSLCNKSGAWSAQVVWSTGPAVLSCSGAVVINTEGLSHINRQLLVQRGAIAPSFTWRCWESEE